MAITNFVLTVGMKHVWSRCAAGAGHLSDRILFIAYNHRLISCAVGVGAVFMLMKTDIRTSSSMLRRNLKHIRGWMEEQTAAAEYAGGESRVGGFGECMGLVVDEVLLEERR